MDVATQSKERQSALPDAWVDRLFQRLASVYGTEKFTALWRGQEMDDVRRTWADELSGYSAFELKTGLDSLRRTNPSWPPTLYEFAELCRPTTIDPESALNEAVKGIYARRDGQPGQWSHRAIYWATQDVSAHDVLNCTWPQIRTRWTAALEKRLADPNLSAIPEVPKALPAPARTNLPPNIEALLAGLSKEKKDARGWAKKILERKARNDPTLPEIAYRMALNSENIR